MLNTDVDTWSKPMVPGESRRLPHSPENGLTTTMWASAITWDDSDIVVEWYIVEEFGTRSYEIAERYLKLGLSGSNVKSFTNEEEAARYYLNRAFNVEL